MEILDVGEFDFPFPRFDILLKHGAIILHLQGFDVVSIIGLNPDLAQVGDLAIQVTRTIMYMKTQICVKTRDGARSWTIVARHQDRSYFSTIFIQSFEH